MLRYIDAPFLNEEELKARETSGIEDSEVELEPDEVLKSSNTKRSKYVKMTEAICEVLSDTNLVAFLPLNIQGA